MAHGCIYTLWGTLTELVMCCLVVSMRQPMNHETTTLEDGARQQIKSVVKIEVHEIYRSINYTMY